MSAPPQGRDWPSVGEVVEAFEDALARGEDAELADFMPAPDHPARLAILCELVRVDLEHAWEAGRPRRLEDYRGLDPGLFNDLDLLRAMAFEEYRLRLQAGETPSPADYQRRFGLDTGAWPAPAAEPPVAPPKSPEPARHEPGLDARAVSAEILRSLDRADPHAAERLAEALSGLPRVGAEFLGFRLCGELGRGAFGRVYLARQGDLADRLVALKVSADVAGESHALARLQHTNVVPIHSVHRRGPLQAVCMPYLGATTLADTLATIRTQAALPDSGAGLLSSLRSRRASSTPSTAPAAPPTATALEKAASSGIDLTAEAPAGDPAAGAQVERLRALGYVPAVLWVIARVADGLAHAHERGILHRDLKPANILFSDDGEPVLLDFNLAADTRSGLGAAVALVGGTLPYMAPEQLHAFLHREPAADPRSDVFALGVILYELLTGAHPFPVRSGDVDAILPDMIADRRATVPDPRQSNPSVSPAVASVVRHCLEPDPTRRYQSARQLQEDLNRQLDHLPLRHAPDPSWRERLGKWARRNPRLTSSTTVGLVALATLASVASALTVRHRQYERATAAASYHRLAGERRQALALLTTPSADPVLNEEGVRLCEAAVGRYGVVDDPSWLTRPLCASLPVSDRDQVRRDLGDLLVAWAQALTRRATTGASPSRSDDLAAAALRLDRAEACYGPGSATRALVLARAEVERLSGRDASARRLQVQAASIPLRTPRERLLVDPGQLDDETWRRLPADLEALTAGDPQDFAVWVALGNGRARAGQATDALAAYDVAVAMAPRQSWVRYNRALAFLERQDFRQALKDLDRVVEERPDVPSVFLNRALARLGLKDARGAVDDLGRCLALKGAPTRAWFIRAQAREKLGDRQGARLDRERGLSLMPNDPSSFVARGLARLPRDVQGALADFDAALALDPTYPHALQDRASLLSESLGKPDEAIQALDRAVEAHPSFVEARAGRAVLLARLGRRDDAVRDAQAAVALDQRPLTLYQAACVYALTAKHRPDDAHAAFRLIAEAASKDGSWVAVARNDPDLDPIRRQPEFDELLRSLDVVRKVANPQ